MAITVYRNPRPAYQGSTRRARLPANWPELRAEALRLNPAQVCHRCHRPGGTTLDHIERGDVHDQSNLDWIHDVQDVKAGRSKVNCHGRKTGAEGAAARERINGPEEVHPAFG